MTEIEQILTDLAQQIMLNNLRHLNQSIEDFNNLLSRDPELALKNLSMLSKEDQQTPPAIIEKMIDIAGWRLPDGMVDTAKIYLDPCCGRGSILVYLHKHYNVPKENLYGIDIKQENVMLCNKFGFNAIKGDALKPEMYIKVGALIKQIKGEPMTIDRVLMNPPYNGSLHLEILQSVLNILKTLNPDCEIVSIQPCDWLENPLTTYKGGEYKKFFNGTLLALTNLQVIDMMTAQKAFNIGTDVDLGIYTYSTNKLKFDLDLIRAPIANSCFNKIITKLETVETLNDALDEKAVDGWRVKLNELRPNNGGTNPKANGYSHKTCAIQLVSSTENGIKECVFKDGYNDEGIYWTDVRSKNQFGKTGGAVFRHSIKTEDKQTALNIAESCNTEFYRNWIYLIKFNQHMPLRFLPYMGDELNPMTGLTGYKTIWTNEAYCKFFGLTEEESEFMCRKVDDYRVKDFINYIKLDEE